jgi:hypothetical protein
MERAIPDQWVFRIAAATRDLVKACGGLERAAFIAKISTSQLSRCQQADVACNILGIDRAMALEADCGLPLVTSVMADFIGRQVSEPPPAGSSSSSDTVFESHAETVLATAKVIYEGEKARADGQLSPAEAEVLDRAYADLIVSASNARNHFASIKAGGAQLRVVRA